MTKRNILIVIILMTALNGFAQFKISGRVQNFKGVDSLTLNIPFVYGNYHENDIKIAINNNGKFLSKIPISTQQFATLTYKGTMTTLLLSPGKSLSVFIDSTGKLQQFSGTAGEENQLLYEAKLNEAPFFLQGDYNHNSYAQLSAADMQEKVVKPWFKMRDESIRRIQASKISHMDRKLISSEIYYQAYGELNYFTHGIIHGNKELVNEFVSANYDSLKTDPAVFPAGPWYYYFAESYLNYLDDKIFAAYGVTDARSKEPFRNIYHISLDSALALVKQNGGSYIRWYLFKQYFNKKVGEQYLAQNILTVCFNKDISHVKPLMLEFKTNFPNSTYTRILQKKVNELEQISKQNEHLKNINVFADYKKVTSIYEVVNTFRGKVIYLDIWGTWCGPCKRELTYNPRLKQRFKGKDIVFVYLDMDEEEKDSDWKRFIHLNGITGIHLRKSQAEIQKIWEELLPGKKEHLYPSYFIFDKNGKLAQADAKQPSDGDKLYTELEKYL